MSHIGPYQGTGCYVLRRWAEANAGTLERYLAGYIEALRWVLAPVNRGAAAALIAERVRSAPDIAEAAWDRAADPVNGLAPDARFDLEGFRNQMALAPSSWAPGAASHPSQGNILDLSYYQRALAGLGN